jgi:predicted glycogen debranching enzyme
VLRFGPELLGDVAEAARREWLLADGRGGYAATTPLGLNARREHALLNVAQAAPAQRLSLLSRLEETLVVGGRRYDLGVNQYRDVVHPRGHERARDFVLDPLPTLTWEIEGRRVSRTIARVHGEPAVVVLYEHDSTEPMGLEVRPLLSYREPGRLQHENPQVRPEATVTSGDVFVQPYEGCPPLALRLTGGRWEADPTWYRGFVYERDREAGRDHVEDLFSPGRLVAEIRPRASVAFIAWVHRIPALTDGGSRVAAERRRLRAVADAPEGVLADLRRAADAFVVKRPDGVPAIVSAYPEGETGGVDAMLALPGLLLATGRLEEARAILADFAARVAAERAEGGAAVDAETGLWWTVAVERLVEAAGDRDFVRSKLQGALLTVLEGVRAGTGTLVMTPDGLVKPKAEERAPFAVERQAVWYNALAIGAELAKGAGQTARAGEWSALASRVRDTFLRVFWAERPGHLADRAEEWTSDPALGPRQVYALSLPHALLPRDRAQRVLDALRRGLLTPVGLRADGAARPALGAAYFEALIRVHGEAAKPDAWRWLDAFAPRLRDPGLGQLSEAYLPDSPHSPAGAPASAVSVAEVLRLWTRLGRRPTPRPARPS